VKHLIKYCLLIFAIILIAAFGSCRKELAKSEAFAVVDKIALSYGNKRIFHSFEIKNTGDKTLSYRLEEQSEWLEISTMQGEISGKSSLAITGKISRIGLPRGNYQSVIKVFTSTGDFDISVFMNVEMYLLTFINPVYTTINLRFDTLLLSPDTNRFVRRIGKQDSVQFGFFAPPPLIVYYAETYGRYSDSTQLGLKMQWKGNRFLETNENPRLFLDVSKAFFHLSIINNFHVLNPLYVNAGSPVEFLENIFIYQSSDPLPIGYYHARNNTVIRAYITGSTSAITWSNGAQFTLTDTVNQSVIVSSFNNDTIGMKTRPIRKHNSDISRRYGKVIRLESD